VLTDGVIVLDARRFDDLPGRFTGADAELATRLGWYAVTSVSGTVEAAIESWRIAWRTAGRTRAFAIRDARTNDAVGQCQIRLLDGAIADLSYLVFSPFRGRGYATRAVRLACVYAFQELHVARVELSIEATNVASRQVARRAGFVARKTDRDVVVYWLTTPAK
jgi:RimJ/RimL family protein N-acetyltransferase